ncbi:unnamed protein product [Lathyrus sativus]|nr:unnamed protein product [Lathyrus sativus]
MASEPNKKRKIDEAPFLGARVSSKNGKNAITATNANRSMVASQSSGMNVTVSQNKYFATSQAQQEGCTGNYKIFDSPFGNFLLPVIPTRAELS